MNANLSLQREVLHHLALDPVLDAAAIGVAVCDGVVILSGVVSGESARQRADTIAQRVPRVRAIANEIRVRTTGDEVRTDVDIARGAADVLRCHGSGPHETIRLTVQDGHITLSGSVAQPDQRNAAEEAVRHVRGVVGVTNTMVVAPTVAAEAVMAQITTAFSPGDSLVAKQIMVETYGTKVMLWGVAGSWEAYNAIQDAAWSTPGVTRVENHVSVDA